MTDTMDDYRRLGAPNFIDNFLTPLWHLLFGQQMRAKDLVRNLPAPDRMAEIERSAPARKRRHLQ
jgi:hypothetical protein